MTIYLYILLFIIGACLGSFLCCQARRLYLGTNAKGKKQKLGSRSICLHCKYQLRWYDNIPILSWIFLRGKCRKCNKKIGYAEIISELGLAVSFVALGTTVNLANTTVLSWTTFVAVLVLVCVLFFLAIYDGLYGELPVLFLIISILCAIVVLILKGWSVLTAGPFTSELIWKPLLSILILGGLYLVLYLISKGRWVGDGDWILGVAIAIALFDPWLALVTLFLANLLASLIMAPLSFKRKHHKIYFGPFMVAAFIIVYSLADFLQSFLK